MPQSSKTQSPKTRAEQRAETAKRLRVAARTLIAERGIEKATIRAIAEREDLAVGTVMAHFGTKEDLFFEVFYEDLEALAARGLAAAEHERTLVDRLCALAEALLRGFAENPQLYGALMRRGLFARGSWGMRFEEQVRTTAIEIARWYRAQWAELTPAELEAAIRSFFALYYFTLLQLLKKDFDELEQGLVSLRAMVEMHVGGLR